MFLGCMVLPIDVLCVVQDFNADWQRAASSLLVSIGSHVPDLVGFSTEHELFFETGLFSSI